MRKKIVQTKLTKPARLKYNHPVGTPVTKVDFYINNKGERTCFTWPKVDGLYFERAKEALEEATKKREIIFANRRPVNPKDLTQGQAFINSNEVFNFFSLACEGISLLFGAVEALVNNLIELISSRSYTERKYIKLVQLGRLRLQVRKKVQLTDEQLLFKNIGDKLKRVLSLYYKIGSLVKEPFWASFILLKRLRDGMLHPRRSKIYGADKGRNSIFAELFEVDFEKLTTDIESLLEYLEKNSRINSKEKRKN